MVEPKLEIKKTPFWCWMVTKRRLSPDSQLFEEGDVYCKLAAKYLPVNCVQQIQRIGQFVCGISNCVKAFDSVMLYELHYNSAHRNACQTCKKVYPSAHLLDIHILERHDTVFQLMAQKQKMYQCLVEECPDKFMDAMLRKDHLIKVHKYPANYRYVNTKKTSNFPKFNRNGDSLVGNEKMDCTSSSDPCPEVTSSSNRVFSYKIPKHISFGQGAPPGFLRGKGHAKGGKQHKKHWHNKDSMDTSTAVAIESVNMQDLSDALP